MFFFIEFGRGDIILRALQLFMPKKARENLFNE
jgi:hypothetical protein